MIGVLWSVVWWGLYGVYIDIIGDYVLYGIFYFLIQSVVGGFLGLNVVVIGNLFDIVKIRFQVIVEKLKMK